jgi:hypothetical protein
MATPVDRQSSLFQPPKIELDQGEVATGAAAVGSRDEYRHHGFATH